ncbi:pyridoxamine 5'-phosphate oxidase family protein [Sneathiella chinensis]|uniref:Pyridoxamine 5'-phosphate oxidase N-terminal domain-containing protein n=1 Tax=Sneathiella chinensis TaxID=349750 RepID=A0ABQ5U728_9PROT|nr:pyridoxamine 5'-phosphate oxidase family protein [Sneathiella chinensis]GLQ07703.1 hypothetical protein GCM10007924_29240 [Sneathiella chinensis]
MKIDTLEKLESLYGPVREAVRKKLLPSLDPHSRHFISLSPFLVMATSNRDGWEDASPKGDEPGFVRVVDDKTLLIPDRIGNNLTDSLRNILENPEIGLIFFLPGIRETLRVNGPADIIAAPDLLQEFSVNGKPPRSVIRVTVREAYMHCGKSIIRSDLWGDSHRIDQKSFPSLGQILADQIAGHDVRELDAALETSYKEKLY